MKKHLLILISLINISCLADNNELNISSASGTFDKEYYDQNSVEIDIFKYSNNDRRVVDINLYLSNKETILLRILNLEKVAKETIISFDNSNIIITYNDGVSSEYATSGHIFTEEIDIENEIIVGAFDLNFSSGDIKGSFYASKLNWLDGVAMGDIPPDPNLITILNKREEGQTSFIFKADPGAFSPNATFLLRDRESKREIREGNANEEGSVYLDITDGTSSFSNSFNLEVKQGSSEFIKVTNGQLMIE